MPKVNLYYKFTQTGTFWSGSSPGGTKNIGVFAPPKLQKSYFLIVFSIFS